MNPLVLFIVGPTASGKSAVAFELAKHLNGEIISADSMQIYKGMDIGTAKPSRWQRQKIRHHLMDELPVSSNFSVFRFYTQALKAIRAIHKKGKVPIVAGGTGFYVRSLLQGLQAGPDANPALRKKLEKIAAEKGPSYLYAQLQKENPKRAAQINPNDLKRIIRALEMCEPSNQENIDCFAHKNHGLAMTEPSPRSDSEFLPSLISLGFKVRVIGIRKDREKLYQDINRRVDAMFRKGLVREAKRLCRGRMSRTAKQALGYKEIWDSLQKKDSLKTARETIKLRTRHFAKRQITWFKKEPGIRWFDWESGINVPKMAAKILSNLSS